MSSERSRSRIIGLGASAALHVCLALMALWPGRPIPHVSAMAGRSPATHLVHPRPPVMTSALPASNEMSRGRVSPERRGALSVLQPITQLSNGDRSDVRAWLNHLWQSTVFACVVGLLTLMFRKNRASVRYGLWFIASIKFFVPVSLLAALGSRLLWTPVAPGQPPAALLTLAQIGQPFLNGESTVAPPLSWPDPTGWMGFVALGIWACGLAIIVRLRWQVWRQIRRVVRTSVAVDIAGVALPPGVQLREAPGLVGPGAVGFWRPIVLIPVGIERHLSPAQLEAVLTHELCHIKRQDNLTAAMHMLVEAVFWFHPLVWWIGARLVDERERACDEEVLRHCGQPRAYAEGILNVCRRYVDARLACVSGVAGSDLEKRIEAIMRNQVGDALGVWRKLLLATAAIATVIAPIVVGAHGGPPLRAQSPARTGEGPAFEVASIKANRSRDARSALMPQPGGRLTATNVTVAELIRFAYDLPAFQVSGGPGWLGSDRFDVMAKADGDPPSAQKRLMLRRLLAERFKVAAHTETRELALYALVMARADGKIGRRLRPAEADCTRTDQPWSESVGPSPTNGPPRCGYFGFAPGTDFPSGRGGLAFRGLTMAALAKTLVPMVGRSVIDRTGLPGAYDGEFDFIAELPLPPPPPGVPSPFGSDPFASVFTVFPQQLGLKLDARRGPVEILVIDRAEHPVDN